jgi:hypothetical protein
VLYKWFTAICSESKAMTVPVVLEKAKLFNDEIKITASAHSLRIGCKILRNQHMKEISRQHTPPISCVAQYRSSNRKLYIRTQVSISTVC